MKLTFDGLLDMGAQAVADNLRVTVKTNFGPAVTVYQAGGGAGAGGGFNLAKLLGLKVAVTVDGPTGTLYQSSEPPPTEPLRVTFLLAAVAALAFLLLRGIR